jgi:hypothetical protein
MLNELFLGRLMTSAAGFDSSPAFKGGNGDIGLIDPAQLSYLGYSQGGILGGALTAVSNEFSRAVLGVGAMNYSTLINRSSDGTPFLQVLDQSYPNLLDQQLIFSLIQMLWDRAASRYPAASGPDPGGIRRPPGLQHRDPGRGANHRRSCPRASTAFRGCLLRPVLGPADPAIQRVPGISDLHVVHAG